MKYRVSVRLPRYKQVFLSVVEIMFCDNFFQSEVTKPRGGSLFLENDDGGELFPSSPKTKPVPAAAKWVLTIKLLL